LNSDACVFEVLKVKIDGAYSGKHSLDVAKLDYMLYILITVMVFRLHFVLAHGSSEQPEYRLNRGHL